MTDLRDTTAPVTGSTSGIGQAAATALAGRGAHVLIVGRHGRRARDVVPKIEGRRDSRSRRRPVSNVIPVGVDDHE